MIELEQFAEVVVFPLKTAFLLGIVAVPVQQSLQLLYIDVVSFNTISKAFLGGT
jgi:hypothetical protein